MYSGELTAEQYAIVTQPADTRLFLRGPAGCGKTTTGVERLLHLLESGIPGQQILVLTPQRTLSIPYQEALQTPGVVAGGSVTLVTIGGLARRMVDLFWPLVAGPAGFEHPDQPPTFLTLETAQYYMAHLVRPLLDEGFFETVTLDRSRLYSQILDNLNKAAAVGFPVEEIGPRLKSAWVGEPAQARVYDDAQECALRFRQYCRQHNLLDFSLQLELLTRYLWPNPVCQRYLQAGYRHVIYDNIEEDIPVAHDLLADWLPALDSALLIFDEDAGYRSFLGADPENASSLQELCDTTDRLQESFVASQSISELETLLLENLAGTALSQRLLRDRPAVQISPALAFTTERLRYYPEMLDWVAARLDELVHEAGVPPAEIVVLAPFMSDALRYALTDRLSARGIAVRAHRPSRALRDEPAARCLLTLAALAHPGWGLTPTRFDLAYALLQAISGLDLVRAQLLVEIVYRFEAGLPVLTSFQEIIPQTQSRLTYLLGERYERLRLWLAETAQAPPVELDIFLSRLFGELLSQPGFGFYQDLNAGATTANLIESVQKFRWVAGPTLDAKRIPLGQEYLSMVQDGVIAAQYIRSWQPPEADAVLLAPAYTFLLSNRPVSYQFWLDVGSRGWFERLFQPLTHPHVLSRAWDTGRVWNAEDEFEAARASLSRLLSGLLRRCRRRVYLGLSELNEQGYEQRSPLLAAIQRTLRQLHHSPAGPG